MPKRSLPKQICFTDKPATLRYGFAFLASLILSAFHLSFFDLFTTAPYLAFYPVLFLISTVLGFGPAVFSLVLIGLERNFIVMSPGLSFNTPTLIDIGQFGVLGVTSFVVVWIMDNNQTKEVQKNISENEKKLITIFDTISEIAWTAKPNGVMDFYNKRWFDYTGLSEEDSKNPSWERALHPDDKDTVINNWRHSIQAERSYKVECRFKDRKNKSYRWFLVHVQPVKNSEGKLTQWIGTCTDIDEQKKAQELLKKNGQEFKLITETIPQAIWRTKPDGSADYFSRKFYDIVGYSQREYHNWEWLTVLHPEDQERVKAEMQRTHAEGIPFSIECRVLCEDKTYKWYMVMGNPFFQEDEIINYYGTWTDINEQKSSEVEILKTLHSKDEFINIASHELKTPLTSLKLQAQIVKRALDKNDHSVLSKEKVILFSEQVMRSITKLNKLVDDMLDFSRIRMDKFSLAPQRIRLDKVLKESLEKISEQFTALGVESPILLRCDEMEGDWDKQRLEQVFNNLLVNALKYGQGKSVKVSLEKKGNTAFFSIKDEGMGIRKEQLPKIFDRFERGISATEVSGLGLGLFIARQIVEAQGGKIWVDSEENKGSVFYIELPLREGI